MLCHALILGLPRKGEAAEARLLISLFRAFVLSCFRDPPRLDSRKPERTKLRNDGLRPSVTASLLPPPFTARLQNRMATRALKLGPNLDQVAAANRADRLPRRILIGLGG